MVINCRPLAKNMKMIKQKYILIFIVWLAACPLWGQASFGINGQIENDRLILEIQADILDKPMLLVRRNAGYHQVNWTKEGGFILLSISLIPSETGILIPPIYRNKRIDNQILGRFPIIEDKNIRDSYVIDVT